MALRYSTKRGQHALEYTAGHGNLRIMLDKTNPEYLGWCIFIVRFDGPTYVESTRVETVYHSYSQTLREAKERAQLFVDAADILAHA